MMRSTHVLTISLAGLAGLLLVACATPPVEHLYRLDYPLASSSRAEAQYELVVATIKLPETVNRQQLVIQKSATESIVSDEQRWLAPLDEQLTNALTAHLRKNLPDAWLSFDTGISTTSSLPRYHVKVQINQLLINSGEQLTLEASWAVLDSSRKLKKREHQVFTVRLNGTAYEAVAPAMSEVVRQLAEQVGASVAEARK